MVANNISKIGRDEQLVYGEEANDTLKGRGIYQPKNESKKLVIDNKE